MRWPCSRREPQSITVHQQWPGTHGSRCSVYIRHKSNPSQVSEELPGTSLGGSLSILGHNIGMDSFVRVKLTCRNKLPISKVICGANEFSPNSSGFCFWAMTHIPPISIHWKGSFKEASAKSRHLTVLMEDEDSRWWLHGYLLKTSVLVCVLNQVIWWDGEEIGHCGRGSFFPKMHLRESFCAWEMMGCEQRNKFENQRLALSVVLLRQTFEKLNWTSELFVSRRTQKRCLSQSTCFLQALYSFNLEQKFKHVYYMMFNWKLNFKLMVPRACGHKHLEASALRRWQTKHCCECGLSHWDSCGESRVPAFSRVTSLPLTDGFLLFKQGLIRLKT